MKPVLLTILRCPACRSALRFTDDSAPSAQWENGTLHCCTCRSSYPVRDGVPRMLLQDGLVEHTRKGFEYQWRTRQQGKAERKTTVYGYDIPNFMQWFIANFTQGLQAAPQGKVWLLDVRCGSAEKARILALRFPQHQVVAIDQSGSIAFTAQQNADVPNLHFVQANVWYPPFAEKTFQFAMSIGVLHHTPDTWRAFEAIAATVAPGGDLATWIYPLPSEDSFWAGLYRQRDRHFMGIAHRLPKRLTMALCYAYVALLYPLVMRFLEAAVQDQLPGLPAHDLSAAAQPHAAVQERRVPVVRQRHADPPVPSQSPRDEGLVPGVWLHRCQ
ncbi:methyltransferase domain-containing protein [Massilia sp. H-1]|nr:methyltransferase domain-containing protein [Massilia sp. H-1]